MSIEALIVARADAHSGLNSLISGRFYADEGPQDPAGDHIVYERISREPLYTFGLLSMYRDRFQFSCFATTKAGVLALAAQVVSAFSLWAPDTGAGSFQDNAVSGNDLPDTEGEFKRENLDFIITHHQV